MADNAIFLSLWEYFLNTVSKADLKIYPTDEEIQQNGTIIVNGIAIRSDDIPLMKEWSNSFTEHVVNERGDSEKSSLFKCMLKYKKPEVVKWVQARESPTFKYNIKYDGNDWVQSEEKFVKGKGNPFYYDNSVRFKPIDVSQAVSLYKMMVPNKWKRSDYVLTIFDFWKGRTNKGVDIVAMFGHLCLPWGCKLTENPARFVDVNYRDCVTGGSLINLILTRWSKGMSANLKFYRNEMTQHANPGVVRFERKQGVKQAPGVVQEDVKEKLVKQAERMEFKPKYDVATFNYTPDLTYMYPTITEENWKTLPIELRKKIIVSLSQKQNIELYTKKKRTEWFKSQMELDENKNFDKREGLNEFNKQVSQKIMDNKTKKQNRSKQRKELKKKEQANKMNQELTKNGFIKVGEVKIYNSQVPNKTVSRKIPKEIPRRPVDEAEKEQMKQDIKSNGTASEPQDSLDYSKLNEVLDLIEDNEGNEVKVDPTLKEFVEKVDRGEVSLGNGTQRTETKEEVKVQEQAIQETKSATKKKNKPKKLIEFVGVNEEVIFDPDQLLKEKYDSKQLTHTEEEIQKFLKDNSNDEFVRQIQQKHSQEPWFDSMIDAEMVKREELKQAVQGATGMLDASDVSKINEMAGMSIQDLIDQFSKEEEVKLVERDVKKAKSKRNKKNKTKTIPVDKSEGMFVRGEKEDEMVLNDNYEKGEQLNDDNEIIVQSQIDDREKPLKIDNTHYAIPVKDNEQALIYDAEKPIEFVNRFLNKYYANHLSEWMALKLNRDINKKLNKDVKKAKKEKKKMLETGVFTMSDEERESLVSDAKKVINKMEKSKKKKGKGTKGNEGGAQFTANTDMDRRVIKSAYKMKAGFYSTTGNVPVSAMDEKMLILTLKNPPSWWRGTNNLWFNYQSANARSAMKIAKQTATIIVGSNMPKVPVDQPEKYQYSPVIPPFSNSKHIDWTVMRMNIQAAIKEAKQEVRYIVPEEETYDIKFFCPYSKELLEMYCAISQIDSKVRGHIDDIQPVYEYSKMEDEQEVKGSICGYWVKMSLTIPDITSERLAKEEEIPQICYVPSYINSNFAYPGHVMSVVIMGQNDPKNVCQVSNEDLTKFKAKVLTTMNENRIFTGSVVGQLARYSQCYSLKGATKVADKGIVAKVVKNRFRPTDFNLQIMNCFENIATAALNATAGEIQTKSSSGMLYNDAKKSILTVLGDSLIAYIAMLEGKMPEVFKYYEMKPKFELQSIGAIYSKTRSIFVSNSCSQLLSNIIFAGVYDLFQPENVILSSKEEVYMFCEINKLGVNQQMFLKQLIRNENLLKNSKLFFAYSDNLYTLVDGCFTSYDGSKMESQIKSQYIKEMGESVLKKSAKLMKNTTYEIDVTGLDVIDEDKFVDSGKVTTKTKIPHKIYNNVKQYYINVDSLKKYRPEVLRPDIIASMKDNSKMLGMLRAYSYSSVAKFKLVGKKKYLHLNSVFSSVKRVKNQYYSYTDEEGQLQTGESYVLKITLSSYIPQMLHTYVEEWLPKIFEEGQAFLGAVKYPLGFLPSGWRTTSLLNTILTMTACKKFTEYSERGLVTREHDQFEEDILDNKFDQLRFTKEASVSNVWKLKEGVNSFDFLGFDVVKKGDYRWVQLRDSSLYSGPFWYNPQTYSQNTLVDWTYSFTKWISAMFNGGVMDPCMVNIFVNFARQIGETEEENVIQLFILVMEGNLRDVVNGALRTSDKVGKLLLAAWAFCDIDADVEGHEPPQHIKMAVEALKDIKVRKSDTVPIISDVSKRVLAVEKRWPQEEDRYYRIAVCVLAGLDPLVGSRMTISEVKFWLSYLKQHGAEGLINTLDVPGVPIEQVEEARAKVKTYM